MTLRVVTVVLAAGRGERMGGPKALLGWRLPGEVAERPLAAAHAAARLAAESAEVVVVVREPTRRLLLPWLSVGTVAVASQAPDALGAAGSIGCAAGWLADNRRGASAPDVVLVTPVDCLPAASSVIAALLEVLERDRTALAARPVCGSRRGHPVVLRTQALAPYLGTAPPVLREWLTSLGRAVRDVPVADPLVLVDLNRAESLARLGLGPPRFLGR